MQQHDKTKSLLFLFERQCLTFAVGLVLILSACTPVATIEYPIPTEPINTKVTFVTPRVTETSIPFSTVEITPSPVETATKYPNLLTYKNGAGQELTIELSLRTYSNKNGISISIPQTPNPRAAIKYLADNSVWYPPETDQVSALVDFVKDPTLEKYLEQFDAVDLVKNRRYWLGSYPPVDTYGTPFFLALVLSWRGRSLIVGQHENGSYYAIYLDREPKSGFMDNVRYSFSVNIGYLLELANEHLND